MPHSDSLCLNVTKRKRAIAFVGKPRFIPVMAECPRGMRHFYPET